MNAITKLSWSDIEEDLVRVSGEILSDGKPDMILTIQRGGFVPSAILSHNLDLRDVIVADINVTESDEVNAKKTSPSVNDIEALQKSKDLDLLIVDDIIGSGSTIKSILKHLEKYPPSKIRIATCVVNNANLEKSPNTTDSLGVTYIGRSVRGWVVFPWERLECGAAEI